VSYAVETKTDVLRSTLKKLFDRLRDHKTIESCLSSHSSKLHAP